MSHIAFASGWGKLLWRSLVSCRVLVNLVTSLLMAARCSDEPWFGEASKHAFGLCGETFGLIDETCSAVPAVM